MELNPFQGPVGQADLGCYGPNMGVRGVGVVVGDPVFRVLFFYLHCAFKSPALELESPQYQTHGSA